MSSITSLQVYVQWWRTWKTLPVFSWITAARFYRSGQYSQAEQFYRKGLERYSDHPARISAQLDLAYCLFKQKKIVEAEQLLRSIVSAHPEQREGYVRLARIQYWLGKSADAALTLRRGMQYFDADPELSALLMFALIDYGASGYLISEAVTQAKRAIDNHPGHKLLKVAQARCLFHVGEQARGKELLVGLALEDPALFEAVVAYAEILIEEERIDEAQIHLRRALQVSPHHPRVLSMMAHTYLLDSPAFNPDFGQQLAVSACQSSAWASPRDMHVLAEAYSQSGDKMAALVTASRARDIGVQNDREFARGATLERLIESLRADIQA